MKKLLVFLFLVLAMQAKAQLTMSELLRIGRMPNNAYNVNALSFIEASDALQLMGYPLMRFLPNAVGVDRFYTLYFQRGGNDKVTMESQYIKSGGVLKIIFKTNLSTSDIDQFNAMLNNAMNHPDFEMVGPSLLVNNFKSKTATGIREQLTFTKGYNVLPSGEFNIAIPIVYTISYSREY